MANKQYRFIASILDMNQKFIITNTSLYDTFLEAYRHCFVGISKEDDDYCSKMYTAVQDDFTKGETLVSVSHKTRDGTLEVCWIQVVNGDDSDVEIPPLELKGTCCVWPRKA
jgi:hypothetical protein